jgi:PAS domain S-box-containing protein
MLQVPPIIVGITLIVLGVAGYIVVNHLLSTMNRNKRWKQNKSSIQLPLHLPSNSNAYLLIASGGRILYTNPVARDWFSLNGNKPDLERLASEIQPNEAFFSLCVQEGMSRFNLGERVIEGISYPISYDSTDAMLITFRRIDQKDKVPFQSPVSPSNSNKSILKEKVLQETLEHPTLPKTPSLIDNDLEILSKSEETRRLTLELEKRVEKRTRELKIEHQRAETLLRIMTELSASLDFERVLQRTLEVLNSVIGASHATCMVLQPSNKKLSHIATVGYPNPVPPGGLPSTLNTNQGLVGWIISNRQAVLIDNVLEDERWVQLPHTWYQHRSAVGAPIIMGDQLMGVLLLYHPEVGYFSDEQLDLIQVSANQMAVAINNAELYNLIRDQKDELTNLLRDQIVETSRSNSILEAIADGVLVTDNKGNITLFNHSAERMLFLDRVEVIDQSIEHLSSSVGGAAGVWIETIKTWMQESESLTPMQTLSEQINLSTGDVLSVNLAPVMNQDEFLGTVSVFRDITHLIEVDRLKSEFVATVSHELRTPMTSIKGYVDILLMGAAGPLQEQQLHFLEVVQQNTERLTILVNDLLDLSRIEAGQVNLECESIDLHNVVLEVAKEIHRLSDSEDKAMQFEVDLPKDLPRVFGDPERIRQILINLLINAYNYTPIGGLVNLSVHVEGNQVQVDIQDTGVGIPPEEQDRIFERFYRGDNHLVYATAGTGLGLSIVQKLIHMHQGRIWVQSNGIPGEGSIFSFTLPIYDFPRHAMRVRENYAENLDC